MTSEGMMLARFGLPLGDQTGFAIPLFGVQKRSNLLYEQDIYQGDDTVSHFFESENFDEFTEFDGNVSQNIKDSAIYAFYDSKEKTIRYGAKSELQDQLVSSQAHLQENVFVALSIAEFLEDLDLIQRFQLAGMNRLEEVNGQEVSDRWVLSQILLPRVRRIIGQHLRGLADRRFELEVQLVLRQDQNFQVLVDGNLFDVLLNLPTSMANALKTDVRQALMFGKFVPQRVAFLRGTTHRAQSFEVIEFEGAMLAGDVDKKTTQFAKKKGISHIDKQLVIDCSEVTYADIGGLLAINSVLARRQSYNVPTRIKLPHRKSVRDFFRLANWPDAIHNVTGTRFSSLVVADDITYFGESSGKTELRNSSKNPWAIHTYYNRSRSGTSQLPQSRGFEVIPRNIETRKRLIDFSDLMGSDRKGRRELLALDDAYSAFMEFYRDSAEPVVSQFGIQLGTFSKKSRPSGTSLRFFHWDDGHSLIPMGLSSHLSEVEKHQTNQQGNRRYEYKVLPAANSSLDWPKMIELNGETQPPDWICFLVFDDKSLFPGPKAEVSEIFRCAVLELHGSLTFQSGGHFIRLYWKESTYGSKKPNTLFLHHSFSKSRGEVFSGNLITTDFRVHGQVEKKSEFEF